VSSAGIGATHATAVDVESRDGQTGSRTPHRHHEENATSPSSAVQPSDRFFPPDPAQRRIARDLYEGIAGLPIVSPHGHVDPRLLADENASFGTPADLFIIPDHYVFRMLYSQGIPLESLGVPRIAGGEVEGADSARDHRKIWQTFAENF
jgi:glucuronate isomerase